MGKFVTVLNEWSKSMLRPILCSSQPGRLQIFLSYEREHFRVVLIAIVFCRYAIFKVGKKLNKKTTNKLADMNQKLYLRKCYRQFLSNSWRIEELWIIPQYQNYFWKLLINSFERRRVKGARIAWHGDKLWIKCLTTASLL